MEKRICDELGISVTWKSSDQISESTGQKCQGGFWENLDEIYAGDIQTCAYQGGFICGQDQTCPGEWLNASDTESCCSQTCTSYLWEDLNQDGSVDALDLTLCVNVFLGIELDLNYTDRADVNRDGVVDRLDIRQLMGRMFDG